MVLKRQKRQNLNQKDIDLTNPTGIKPVEHKCLIKTAIIEKKTSGGIYLTEESAKNRQYLDVEVDLIAVGGNAFSQWDGDIPFPGDKVLIDKYAGGDGIVGHEGYKMVLDRDITAIVIRS